MPKASKQSQDAEGHEPDDAMNATDPCSNQKPYRCPSFSVGALASALNLTKANQLAASLEDEQLIEQLTQSPLTSP